MPQYTDQLNRTIFIPSAPVRIISLVPSQTELLYDLGLSEEVVGLTKFCVHPKQWFREKERVGGTKNLHLEKIGLLKPDLIIANKEENEKEQIEALAETYPVWISDVKTLEDALQMIESIGAITGKQDGAMKIVSNIRIGFKHIALPAGNVKTAYLIWKDPFMTVGGDTFINSMMEMAGFQNVFANRTRYPAIDITDLQTANCDLLLLSTEPYPFTIIHVEVLQRHLPGTTVMLVDGEMFSWYGSRLQKAPAYFNSLHRQIENLSSK